MRRSGDPGRVAPRTGTALLAIACAAVPLAAPEAADLKSRWSIAGGVAYFSTTDNIRSNSTIVLGALGDDGIPYTYDPNEDLSCANPGVYCDLRPDYQTGRSIRIADATQYNLSVSLGMTSWLSLRLDAGYSKSDIGPIDFFLSDLFPRMDLPVHAINAFKDREYTKTITAGELTEVPVSLSGVVRFRVKKEINPYLVAGAGMIYTGVEISDELDAMNLRLNSQRIRGANNELQQDIVPTRLLVLAEAARIPYEWEMVPRSDDAFEWHVGAGIEYFLTERVSLAFEGRYMSTQETLNLDLGDGEDQVNLVTWSEKIYREDGSLKYFAPDDSGPNPLCYEIMNRGVGCGPPYNHVHVNPMTLDFRGIPIYECPAQADFDGNGLVDICWGRGISPGQRGLTEPRGDIIVQGGRINLTNVSAGVSLRVHF